LRLVLSSLAYDEFDNKFMLDGIAIYLNLTFQLDNENSTGVIIVS
jgi:hypothetical protein